MRRSSLPLAGSMTAYFRAAPIPGSSLSRSSYQGRGRIITGEQTGARGSHRAGRKASVYDGLLWLSVDCCRRAMRSAKRARNLALQAVQIEKSEEGTAGLTDEAAG